MLRTRDELTDYLATIVRDTQIESILESCLNVTLGEIWAAYPWSFKRRKQTFSTVVSQEEYQLDEEVEEIAFLRQRTSPRKLLYLPDHLFYALEPDPEGASTGTPRYYRVWEETGFSTNLASADTVYVVSSSTSDGATFNVRIRGRNSSGEIVRETLTLNGTTNVTSSTTWASDGLMDISKSAATTGTISCRRTTGATLLSEMAPDETAPRFKRLSFYPIPSAVITIYMEYYERLHLLTHDTDIPQIDSRWTWVIVEGTLAKVWNYKQKEDAAALAQRNYERGVMLMRQQDERNLDWIPSLHPRAIQRGVVQRVSDSVNNAFPQYTLSGW